MRAVTSQNLHREDNFLCFSPCLSTNAFKILQKWPQVEDKSSLPKPVILPIEESNDIAPATPVQKVVPALPNAIWRRIWKLLDFASLSSISTTNRLFYSFYLESLREEERRKKYGFINFPAELWARQIMQQIRYDGFKRLEYSSQVFRSYIQGSRSLQSQLFRNKVDKKGLNKIFEEKKKMDGRDDRSILGRWISDMTKDEDEDEAKIRTRLIQVQV